MADLSNNYSDGNFKWLNKNNQLADNLPPLPIPDQRIISGLYAINILTDVQNISVKVVKDGNIVAHFVLSEIASIDLRGSQIIVYSSDELPVVLNFVSIVEASNADSRFTVCLNGGIAS